MVRHPRVLFLSAALVSAASVAAQPAAHQETATVTAVEIPVQVIVDGVPVRGLAAENFAVFEKRREHPIVAFEAVDLAALPEGEATQRRLSPHARRRFLLLFDLSFSSPSSVVRARRAARDVVLNHLTPHDLVAVATYASSRGARIVLGFTSDRWQIEWALQSLGLVEPIEKVNDPLGLMLADLESALSQSATEGGGSGRRGSDEANLKWVIDSIFIENLQDLSAESGKRNREVVEKQILSMASSYGELARLLDSVQGLKQIILLSEGFDSRVLVGTEDAQRVAEMAEQAARGEVWRVGSDERFGSSAAQSGLNEMIEEFRRCDCVIQAVDIGGLRAGPQVTGPARGEHGLYVMSKETGGELYRNFNDLGAAMGEILERSAVSYVLVIQPPDLVADGSFHRLSVKLRDGPRKARLVHRPGYYAPLPFGAQTIAQRQLGAADLLIAGEAGGSLRAAVVAVPDLSLSGEQEVVAAIDLDRASLQSLRGGSRLPLELYAYAFDARGRLRDFFAEVATLEPVVIAQRGETAGFKFFGDLRLPAGSYTLRVLVRHAETGEAGVAITPIRVPRANEALLLPPLFMERESDWLIGWERSRDWVQERYSMARGGETLVPVSRPVLVTGQERPVLLIARHLDAAEPMAGAVLRRLDGSLAAELEIALQESLGAGDDQTSRFWATLRTGQAAPGDYLLEIELGGPQTGERLKSSLPVTVKPPPL